MLRKRTFTGSKSNDITPRETEHRLLARKAAAEGFVLLKNEDGVLPISTDCKIALYGAGAVMTIKGGTGSGDVNERDCVTIKQGLENAGYVLTTNEWLESYRELYNRARIDWRDGILASLPRYQNNFFEAYSTAPFQIPCGDAIDVEAAKQDGADIAMFVLSRIAGENADRHDRPGDYFVTEEEKALVTQICQAYKTVILVINTGGLIDLAFTEELPNIRGILQFMQAGQEGGSAFADVVSGKVSPSGKMTDTWALDYNDYPNASYFSHKSGNVYKEEYKEGIYVGYRYFDTYDIPVRYCFGYGCSYTQFQWKAGAISVNGLEADREQAKAGGGPAVSIEVEVKNTGSRYAGKEVMQVYVSCPQGKLEKEFRRLAGFGKTKELKAGEGQKMKISFALYQLASYDEAQAAWILEKGTYGIWVGDSLASAELAGSIVLDEDARMVQCRHICERKEGLEEKHQNPDKRMAKEAAWLAIAEGLQKVSVKAADIKTECIDYGKDVGADFTKAQKLVDSLTLQQRVAFATGDISRGQNPLGSAGQSVPGAAAETVPVAEAAPWNVASIVLADGPAGLRLSREYQVKDGAIVPGDFLDALEGGFFAPKKEKTGTTYYQYCTAIPVGTLLAQTWNVELIKEMGEMIGREMQLFEVTLWLAPGMNIHRNPLCGRNFEYYSEDPLLSGMMAAAITLGVQKVPGCGTTIKHFACNNQEDNRMGSDSIISERTLREIYLKGFEIAVKNAQPMSIMTSYNMINGVHAANCHDICTKAARNEWGFAGAIMTDWTTTTNSTAGECTASGCMNAGNDMVMPGAEADHEEIYRALEKGTLDEKQLDRCVRNTIHLILQSNQYDDAVSYGEQFHSLDTYMRAEAE